MESIKILKGYDRVSSTLETQNSPKPPNHRPVKPLIITLAISAILFLTLTVALLLAVLIHHSTTGSPESDSFVSNSVDSVRAVCNITRYPTSCFSSIFSLNTSIKPDPESIFKLSLQVSIKELNLTSSLFKSLNGVGSQGAIDDCLSQFGDALSRLNDSLLAMEVGPGEKALTLEKIRDIQTWISAAMTDQQTCVDGLEEMGSTVPDELKTKMANSNQLLSNSLAIVANMQNLLHKFDLKLH